MLNGSLNLRYFTAKFFNQINQRKVLQLLVIIAKLRLEVTKVFCRNINEFSRMISSYCEIHKKHRMTLSGESKLYRNNYVILLVSYYCI